MKNLLLKEPLFLQTIAGKKTVTRRTYGLKQINIDPDRWDIENGVTCSLATDKRTNFSVTLFPKFRIGSMAFLSERYLRSADHVIYSIDYSNEHLDEFLREGYKKVSKLFMKETEARFKVTFLKFSVERLFDISNEDCHKEGIEKIEGMYGVPGMKSRYKTPRTAYFGLFKDINGVCINPFVFRYEYKLC